MVRITWATQLNETFYVLLGGAPILQQDATELLQEEDSDRSTTPEEASDIVKGQFQLLVEETVHNDLCETAKGPIPINGTPCCWFHKYVGRQLPIHPW